MNFKWETKALGEICSKITDGAHTSPPSVVAGKPMASVKDLTRFGVDLSRARLIANEDFEALVKQGCKPQVGDVLIAKDGNSALDTVCTVTKPLDAVLLSSVAILRPNPAILNAEFLKYYLSSSDVIAYLKSNFISGAAIPRVVLRDFKKAIISVPPIEVQTQIASILNALDNRIALLQETNGSLESIAQSLFKSWFVDFDPVRAKQEGRMPEGMDEEAAALFPRSFEESELGLVPSGWHVASIEQVVEGVYDGPHATPPEADTGPIFLGIRNLTGTGLEFSNVRHIHEDQWTQWTRRVVPRHGDIVFSYEATLGFFALIPPETRCCLGRRLALVRPRATNGYGHFWFHQFVAVPFQRLLAKNTIQGATVNRIALKHFPSYAVLNPPDATKLAFEVLVAPIWAKIHDNQAYFHSLVAIRDTLLPRLISGQLRLSETADAIQEAA